MTCWSWGVTHPPSRLLKILYMINLWFQTWVFFITSWGLRLLSSLQVSSLDNPSMHLICSPNFTWLIVSLHLLHFYQGSNLSLSDLHPWLMALYTDSLLGASFTWLIRDLTFHMLWAWSLDSCRSHMSCIGKQVSGSSTTFRVLTIMEFSMQQEWILIWWDIQIQIGQVILGIASLLQSIASHLVLVQFVGRARSILQLLFIDRDGVSRGNKFHHWGYLASKYSH